MSTTKKNDMSIEEMQEQFRFNLNPKQKEVVAKYKEMAASLPPLQEFREYNTHDPHEMHAWADDRPWWLRPLQVVGFVAAGIGLTICIYHSTLILFLL